MTWSRPTSITCNLPIGKVILPKFYSRTIPVDGSFAESMVRKAAEAVATYLLFFPEDETMLHNKKYYLENFDLKPNNFVPRAVSGSILATVHSLEFPF